MHNPRKSLKFYYFIIAQIQPQDETKKKKKRVDIKHKFLKNAKYNKESHVKSAVKNYSTVVSDKKENMKKKTNKQTNMQNVSKNTAHLQFV